MIVNLEHLPEPASIALQSEALAVVLGTLLVARHPAQRYANDWDVVLTEGCAFDRVVPGQLAGVWPPGQCYENARRLVRNARAIGVELLYVEGYALCEGALLEHGWAVTTDGVVLDPTWGTGLPVGYVGVPLDVTAVRPLLAGTNQNTVLFGDFRRARTLHRSGFDPRLFIRNSHPHLARMAPTSSSSTPTTRSAFVSR